MLLIAALGEHIQTYRILVNELLYFGNRIQFMYDGIVEFGEDNVILFIEYQQAVHVICLQFAAAKWRFDDTHAK